MRGTPVLARAYGDEPVRAIFWDVVSGSVGICSPQLYDEWIQRQEDPRPIGFPGDSIYAFDADLYRLLEQAWQHQDWKRLAALWSKAHVLVLGKAN